MNVKAELKNLTSKKGNPYTVLELTFENDFKMRVFLDYNQKFILSQM